MFTADDFQYALENTRLLLGPRRKIETFGNTQFRFHLLTESMDRVNEVRIRDGTVHAERPLLLTPEHHARILLENFGDKASEFADWLRQPGRPLAAVLKYGFQFRRSEVRESVVHDSLEAVGERMSARKWPPRRTRNRSARCCKASTTRGKCACSNSRWTSSRVPAPPTSATCVDAACSNSQPCLLSCSVVRESW